MKLILDFIVNQVLSSPAIVIGLVALVGLLAQRKPITNVVTGTVKTTMGFLILGAGAGYLVDTLLPFGQVVQSIIGVPGVIPTNELVIGFAITEFGAMGAMTMALAYLVNIILARITPWKFLFLSGHIIFFTSYLVVAIFASYLPGLSPTMVVILSALTIGLYMVLAPAIVHPFTKKVTGGDPIALAHSSTTGALLGGVIGSLFNPEDNFEDFKVPESIGFVRDMSVMMALTMGLLFAIAAIWAGPAKVAEITGAGSAFMWVIMSALNFAAGVMVMLTGVRMTIAEIVPAFKGISTKLVPDAVPALDCPVVFPYAPNAVVPGFLAGYLGGFVAMGVLYLTGYPYVIIPGVIPHFFCDATAAVYGDKIGGKKGALIAAFLTGFLLMGIGVAFLLPSTGVLVQTGTTFPDPDMGSIWMIFGQIIRVVSGG